MRTIRQTAIAFLHSLRVRLLVLVFTALLPALFLIIYTAEDHQKHEVNDASSEGLRIARLIAAEQEKTVEGAHQFVMAIAGSPDISSGPAEHRQRFLSSVLRASPAYTSIALADARGNVVCSGVRGYPTGSVASRTWFRDAARTGRFTVGEYEPATVSGTPTLTVCQPILDKKGRVTGMVFAGLDFRWLSQVLDRSERPHRSVIVVLDRKGTVLIRQPDPRIWRGRSAVNAPVYRALVNAGGEGTAHVGSLDGVIRLWAFVPVHSGGEAVGTAMVGVPDDVAFADVRELQIRSLMLLILVTAAIVGTTWVFGDVAVLRRVRALIANSRSIASGDLSVRTPGAARHDELGQLEHAFDEMAASLQMHHENERRADAAIRVSEARYRLLFEATPLPALVYDAETLAFMAMNETAVAAYGYTKDELAAMTMDDIHPCPQAGCPPARQCALRAGRALTGVCRHMRKDGSYLDVEVVSHPLEFAGRPARLVLATDITERLRTQQRLNRMVEQLRGLAQRLESVREEERTRIAREVHDELGQALTGLKMDIAWLRTHTNGATDTAPRLQEMNELIDATIQAVRRIATELRPAVLDALGLVPALEWQANDFSRRTGVACALSGREAALDLDPPSATAVFRIFQEALTNVARHAGARHVAIRLVSNGSGAVLEIADDGVGITEERMAALDALGLLGMRERASVFGGSVTIGPAEERGTCVTVQIPGARAQERGDGASSGSEGNRSGRAHVSEEGDPTAHA